MGSSRCMSCKVVMFRLVAAMGIVWLLLVGTLKSEEEIKWKRTLMTPSSTANPKQEKVFPDDYSMVNPDLDLNYMNKRRVPNGPDPIHNRRAGNSKRPPGRA